MDKLIEGFRRFRDGYFADNRELFDKLAQNGQTPKVLLIGCCDSRVDPAIIFDAQPGEMFVLRNVANLIPPYDPDQKHHGTSAAVEFAVRGLNVEHIVVLGHARCGGVRALVEGAQMAESDFIKGWMCIARSARDRAMALALSSGQPIEAALRVCERETVAISLANLMTFPWVHDRVEAGNLMLHGWFYDMEAGTLSRLDPFTNTFQEV
ncbi:carbonic anhydrase [Magnetospirillum sp. UT-4]|uniref:carbonic anhydrase n=1 Tax=Magnetospirillum sp. UT-4 TaxID=2681467 RepID=UPI00137C5711|nr:carbonic anhydrase [Magnetospirillum sp. UT-4]CAA7625278.1 Carbonic anhydrase [Magnetospirillum sp. UT-4]